MQHQVPQFIDVEDKIFGPLSVRQFIYLAGGAGMIIMLFVFLPRFLAAVIALPVAALAGGLAFYSVNGRGLLFVLKDAVQYFVNTKLFVWEKREKKAKEQKAPQQASAGDVGIPKVAQSKLKDLAWSLDIKESLYSEERLDQRSRT